LAWGKKILDWDPNTNIWTQADFGGATRSEACAFGFALWIYQAALRI
jgi:hypothetical protein